MVLESVTKGYHKICLVLQKGQNMLWHQYFNQPILSKSFISLSLKNVEKFMFSGGYKNEI